MSWIQDWLWPKVDIRRKAKNAIDDGFWAAAFLSGFKGAMALIALLGSLQESALSGGIGAAVYAGLAFGICRRSRTVAVLALIVFVAKRLLLVNSITFGGLVLLSFGSLLFANGVRGTFSFPKFPPLPANLPSVEQNFRAMEDGRA